MIVTVLDLDWKYDNVQNADDYILLQIYYIVYVLLYIWGSAELNIVKIS